MTEFKINEQITFKKVLLIDGEEKKQLSSFAALKIAQEKGLDLVCVNEKSNLPVCKLMDYNKYVYDQKQKEKAIKKDNRIKAKLNEIKEIQVRPQIDIADLNVKIKKLKEFILAGQRVRIVVTLKGRMITKQDLAINLINSILEEVKDIAEMDKKPDLNGKKMISIVKPIKKK